MTAGDRYRNERLPSSPLKVTAADLHNVAPQTFSREEPREETGWGLYPPKTLKPSTQQREEMTENGVLCHKNTTSVESLRQHYGHGEGGGVARGQTKVRFTCQGLINGCCCCLVSVTQSPFSDQTSGFSGLEFQAASVTDFIITSDSHDSILYFYS